MGNSCGCNCVAKEREIDQIVIANNAESAEPDKK